MALILKSKPRISFLTGGVHNSHSLESPVFEGSQVISIFSLELLVSCLIGLFHQGRNLFCVNINAFKVKFLSGCKIHEFGTL